MYCCCYIACGHAAAEIVVKSAFSNSQRSYIVPTLFILIPQAKLEMLKLTDDQLEATTKRTIIENEHMSTELAYQSRQTEKLMARNTQVRTTAHV